MDETPQAVFERAGAAMARRSYAEFFACLDTACLARLAPSVIGWLLTQPALHADPAVAHLPVQDLVRQLAELDGSAQRVLAAQPQGRDVANQLSLQHRDKVKAYDAMLKKAARTPHIADVLGWIETHRRAHGQGGSISQALFVDERLEACVVTNDVATATRRFPGGGTDRIRFVRKKGRWKILAF